MKRKIIMIFLVVLLSLTIVSCQKDTKLPIIDDLTNRPPSWFLKNNSFEPDILKENNYDLTRDLNFSSYDGIYSFINQYLVVGKRDSNDNMKYGVFSFSKNAEVVNPSYNDIWIQSRDYGNGSHHIAALEDHMGQLKVISLTTGEELIPLGTYDFWNYTVNVFFRTITIETSVDGEVNIDRYSYEIDNEGNILKTLIADEEQSDVIDQQVPEPFSDHPDLKDMTYFTHPDGSVTAYKKGKKAFTLKLEERVTDASVFFGKYVYFQYHTEVPFDHKDYTFFDGPDKVLVETYRVDFTTGKVVELKDFNYLIVNWQYALRDKNGVPNLGVMQVRKIVDQQLMPAKDIVFDKNLKPLFVLTDQSAIRKLDDKTYFSSKGYIYNEKMEVKLNMQNYFNPTLVEVNGETYITLADQNFNYGLIDLNGNIIIPFEYQSQLYFTNGTSHAFNVKTNVRVALKADGTFREIDVDNEVVYHNAFSLNDDTREFSLLNGQLLFTLEEFESVTNFYAVYDELGYTLGYYLRTFDGGSYKYRYIKMK